MIRTRDFLVFSGVLTLLLVAITATVVTDALSGAGAQVANVGSFVPPAAIEGAEAPKEKDENPNDNAARLRTKIAAGQGDVPAGEPVFTSVDDIVVDDTPVITDQTPPSSVQIGFTVDGQPLTSDQLWRFVGYSEFEQVGTAMNGTPIFGARVDSAPLDPCGGFDDGTGYKLYLPVGNNVNPSCYGA